MICKRALPKVFWKHIQAYTAKKRETDRHRQTDRQTDRQRETERDRDRDRESLQHQNVSQNQEHFKRET